MAEKVLNLKLFYKNKVLDTARYNRDFTKSFQVGSDKRLFWQILDSAFPKKHKLLSKDGAGYKLHLTDKMEVEFSSGGKIFNRQELVSASKLKNNILKIDKDSSGSINLANNWDIQFSFAVPYQFTPNPQEIAIAKEFAKRPPADAEHRKLTRLVFTGLIFTAILIYIGNMFYVAPVQFNLQDRFDKMQEIATRVTPEIVEVEQAEVQVEVDVAKQKAKTEEQAEEVVAQAEQTSVQEFEDMFGAGFGDDDFEADIFEVDVVGEIAVIGNGTDVTSPGDFTTNRPVTSGNKTLEQASTSSVNLAEGMSGLEGLDDIDLGSGMGLEEIDLSSLGGSTEDFKVTKVQSKQQLAAVKRRFAEIKTVEESALELQTVTPEERNQLSNINMIVKAYKPQITRLYVSERMKVEMYGTLEFELYIETGGQVVGVDIQPASGSFFTDAFLDKAKEIVLNWKINVVKEDLTYSFRMKFVNQ